MYLRQASALAARRASAGAVRRLATGKDVKFGVEGRALMLQGVDMLADAVQVSWLMQCSQCAPSNVVTVIVLCVVQLGML